MISPNERTVTLKIKRRELLDLIMATGAVMQATDAEKWVELENKLKEQLKDFDEKQK